MKLDKGNRIGLLIVGLLLTAAGVAAILAYSGAFGTVTSDRAIADNPVSRYVGTNGSWLWPVAAVIALIVLALAVWWLLRNIFSTDRIRTLILPGSRASEHSTVAGAAVAGAVRDEIDHYRGVQASKVRLTGGPKQPQLAVGVRTDADADLLVLCDRVQHDALAHARQALDRPDLPVRLDLELSRQRLSRVA
jgi:hypothetical protein